MISNVVPLAYPRSPTGVELRKWFQVAALAFAVAELKQWHTGGSPWETGSPDSPLSTASGRAYMRRTLWAMVMFSARTRVDVIKMARDEDVEDAKTVLAELLLELRSHRLKVPPELEAYDMEMRCEELEHGGRRHRRRGEKKAKRKSRDLIIIITVEGIRKVFEIDPTGRSPHWMSGCAICAEALGVVGINMGPKNVEAIWNKYGDDAAWLPPSLPGAS